MIELEKFYIFFDIDGVLNSANWDEESFPIDLNCLKNFADTVNFFRKKYDVHLIMSSSWRDGFDLKNGHSEDVAAILKKMQKFNLEVEDKTPFFIEKNRADEINFYIVEKNLQEKKCLAIDDTKHLFSSEKFFKLYITDAKIGFSRKDFEFLTGANLNIFLRVKRFLQGYNF